MKDFKYYLTAVLMVACAVYIVVGILSGCSNPVSNPEPPKKKHDELHCGLTIVRSCQDCHLIQIKPLERNEL